MSVLSPDAAPGDTRPVAVDRLPYEPTLDGLRALAVGLVMAYHLSGGSIAPGGYIGVDIFFVLSGYLITSLLLRERLGAGRIALRDFYWRRAVRLLPALVVLLAVWSVVFLAFKDDHWLYTLPSGGVLSNKHSPPLVVVAGDLSALFYLTNIVMALGHAVSPLGHLWSLAVEEQFYLVWPVCVVVLFRRGGRVLLWVTGSLAAASAVIAALQWFLTHDGGAVYVAPYTRAQELLAGCCLGIAASLYGVPRWLRSPVTGWLALAGLLAIAFAVDDKAPVRYYLLMPITAALAVGLLGCLTGEPPRLLRRVFASRLAVYIGRRSYALYLWHYVLGTWLRDAGAPGALLAVAASFAAAEISHRLVEAPAARAYRARRHSVRSAGPALAVSGAPDG